MGAWTEEHPPRPTYQNQLLASQSSPPQENLPELSGNYPLRNSAVRGGWGWGGALDLINQIQTTNRNAGKIPNKPVAGTATHLTNQNEPHQGMRCAASPPYLQNNTINSNQNKHYLDHQGESEKERGWVSSNALLTQNKILPPPSKLAWLITQPMTLQYFPIHGKVLSHTPHKIEQPIPPKLFKLKWTFWSISWRPIFFLFLLTSECSQGHFIFGKMGYHLILLIFNKTRRIT